MLVVLLLILLTRQHFSTQQELLIPMLVVNQLQIGNEELNPLGQISSYLVLHLPLHQVNRFLLHLPIFLQLKLSL